ncbi:hypothetical protein BKA82DRAFT_10469 [Pisolithus tinctorius]|nr:hypothetical protein BKA82DRAFT_10469 [Pisolithus tinctorius]
MRDTQGTWFKAKPLRRDRVQGYLFVDRKKTEDTFFARSPCTGYTIRVVDMGNHKVTISMLVDRARAPLRNYPDKSDKSHRGRRASSRGTYKDRAAGTGLAPVRNSGTNYYALQEGGQPRTACYHLMTWCPEVRRTCKEEKWLGVSWHGVMNSE